MINVLYADKNWVICENSFDLEEEGKDAANKVSDEKFKLIIMSMITNCVLRSVNKETAKEIWTALFRKYCVNDIQGINFTRKFFFNCMQETNKSFENFNEREARLREELATAGHEIKKIDSIMRIMEFHYRLTFFYNC